MTIKQKLAAKVLYRANYSAAEIAELLNLDIISVERLITIFKKEGISTKFLFWKILPKATEVLTSYDKGYRMILK